MARQMPSDDAAPPWLTTMSDMNNLLMVFFILLYSFSIQDRKKYTRIADSLEALTGPQDAGTQSATGASAVGDADVAIFRAFEDQKTAVTQVVRPAGHSTLLQKLQEGTLLTLGGEQDAFPEGRWELSDSQMQALAAIKPWLQGRRNAIEIRGHTASNLGDSVVLEPDGRFRPFSREDLQRDDRNALAHHAMLSWLRAEEVRRFLASEHPGLKDKIKVPELHLRTRAEGYTRTVAEGASPAERGRNRRIEVLVTNEVLEK
jgi:flagellar motor protein MotB